MGPPMYRLETYWAFPYPALMHTPLYRPTPPSKKSKTWLSRISRRLDKMSNYYHAYWSIGNRRKNGK
eukprot:scaffold54843_cov31-Attheya_sp.AAC.1